MLINILAAHRLWLRLQSRKTVIRIIHLSKGWCGQKDIMALDFHSGTQQSKVKVMALDEALSILLRIMALTKRGLLSIMVILFRLMMCCRQVVDLLTNLSSRTRSSVRSHSLLGQRRLVVGSKRMVQPYPVQHTPHYLLQ